MTGGVQYLDSDKINFSGNAYGFSANDSSHVASVTMIISVGVATYSRTESTAYSSTFFKLSMFNIDTGIYYEYIYTFTRAIRESKRFIQREFCLIDTIQIW